MNEKYIGMASRYSGEKGSWRRREIELLNVAKCSGRLCIDKHPEYRSDGAHHPPASSGACIPTNVSYLLHHQYSHTCIIAFPIPTLSPSSASFPAHPIKTLFFVFSFFSFNKKNHRAP